MTEDIIFYSIKKMRPNKEVLIGDQHISVDGHKMRLIINQGLENGLNYDNPCLIYQPEYGIYYHKGGKITLESAKLMIKWDDYLAYTHDYLLESNTIPTEVKEIISSRDAIIATYGKFKKIMQG